MSSTTACPGAIRHGREVWRHPPAAGIHARRRVLAATALLFALAFQSFDLGAELLFRSAEQHDSRQQWSDLRKYADPADTAYPRARADGTQIASEEVQVFLRGDITQKDVYSAKVMESLIKKGRQKIAGNLVTLAGNGGDVDAAMEMGRLLRKLGVSTLVPRDSLCLSSCVFVFMGGDQRRVEGRVGIHRPYFSSTRKVENRRQFYRQLQKRLQQYIEELDFPPSFYEALMAVPSESISIVSAADLKRFYLNGMSPSAEEEADAAAARDLGISVLDYLRQKAHAQPCAGVLRADGTCDGEVQKSAWSGASAAFPGRPQAREGVATAAVGGAHKQQAESEDPGPILGATGTR
ncbi:MAG: hypothetical protein IH606_16475 [Burkholderiales bacterium]|nr:hypothetical protein [Burkholderiales bacterium]